ncbi:MAG: hypothetical protein ACKV2O_23610 [Acidimicrobiales bacterium]
MRAVGLRRGGLNHEFAAGWSHYVVSNVAAHAVAQNNSMPVGPTRNPAGQLHG